MAQRETAREHDIFDRFLSLRASDSDLGVGNRLIEMSRHVPDVVALGRGDPDLPTPPHIVEAGQQALRAGHTHYTPLRGLDSLREAIAEKLQRENGIVVDPEEEVLITTGTQEAVVIAALALVDPDDEIIMPDPYYFSYEYAIQYAGGQVVTVPTRLATHFEPDPDDVAKAITSRTKAIVLLTPNNPTGAVYSRDTLERIAEVAMARGIPVISDELYEKLVFEGSEHFSIGSIPGMRGQTITINGFSKSYRMTGWRIGYMVGPARFIRSAQKIKHTLTICAPSFSQYAAVAALTGPQDCLKEGLDTYDERRRAFLTRLDEMGIPYFRPKGTFYVFADMSGFGVGTDELCVEMLQEARVFIYPGGHFGAYGDGFVRISLLAPIPRLMEGLDRIERFLAERWPTSARR